MDEEERRIAEEAAARQQTEAAALERLREEKMKRISAVGDENSQDSETAQQAAGQTS